MQQIKKCYANFDYDMSESLQYLNAANLEYLSKNVKEKIIKTVSLFKYKINKDHEEMTSKIFSAIKNNENVNDLIIKAAHIRGYLG